MRERVGRFYQPRLARTAARMRAGAVRVRSAAVRQRF
jgi:hypothetical protein